MHVYIISDVKFCAFRIQKAFFVMHIKLILALQFINIFEYANRLSAQRVFTIFM